MYIFKEFPQNSIPLLGLEVIVWTLGEMVQGPVASAYVADLSPEHLRGSYQGAWGMTWSVGFILAPLLGTLLFTWSSIGLWLLCALLGIMATALTLLTAGSKAAPKHAISDSQPTPVDAGVQE